MIKVFDKELEERVKKEFGDEATPEFINLLTLGKAAYEHGYHGFIPLEKVAKWVEMMYMGGKHQREVVEMEREGMVHCNSADVINSGSYLDLFGENEGYLSSKKKKKKT